MGLMYTLDKTGDMKSIISQYPEQFAITLKEDNKTHYLIVPADGTIPQPYFQEVLDLINKKDADFEIHESQSSIRQLEKDLQKR